jgi:type I restriction enzyme R subunit
VDLKRFEPGMRQLMDMYLSANSSRKISSFENNSLVELIVKVNEDAGEYPTDRHPKKQEAVAETIENNIRKVIIEAAPGNPKYFERMSQLLDELIGQRKAAVIEYKAYLQLISQLAERVEQPAKSSDYPASLTTVAKRALYDNLDKNEILALAIDHVVQETKQDDWREHRLREKQLMLAVKNLIQDEEKTKAIMAIIKAQHEY